MYEYYLSITLMPRYHQVTMYDMYVRDEKLSHFFVELIHLYQYYLNFDLY